MTRAPRIVDTRAGARIAAAAVVLALQASIPSPLAGQRVAKPSRSDSLTVAANVDGSQPIAGDAVLELTLNRALLPDEGELALVVGGIDVTAVADRTDTGLTYRPDVILLPEGKSELIVYTRKHGLWRELRRIPLAVANAAFSRVVVAKSVTFGNKGQVAEGRSVGAPEPDRRTFQDFVLNAGVNSTHERSGFALETQSNYVGVSRREEALRYFSRGQDAPKLDLSGYLVTVRSPKAAVSLGHVSFGSSRHLVNGFSSRGTSLVLTRGSTIMTAGALNGSPQVGWNDLVGLDRPTHRILGAAVGHELVGAHPGALRLDFTLMDGSILPVTGFNQGAVVDAEQSQGGSVQLTAATPDQRVRFTGGISRSRFDNPLRDEQLTGDTTISDVRRVTRGARFVEVTSTLLQNARLPLAGLTNASFGFRHERVDPLYRSVAAPVAADQQQNSADATISFGAITTQVAQSWTRDNLAAVPSLLTTNGRTGSASMAIPLPSMVGPARHPSFWPMLALMVNRSHQYADELPQNGGYRAQDMPDQLSLNIDASAQWQAGRLRAALRSNRSTQDNRQEARELADFEASVQALSLGWSLGTAGDIGIDLATESQTVKERNETTRVKRLTLNASLRPRPTTSVLAGLSMFHSRPPNATASFNTDQRIELSQGVSLWRDGSGAPRGQFFLRYGRITSLIPDFASSVAGARIGQRQWTVASGFNLRVF